MTHNNKWSPWIGFLLGLAAVVSYFTVVTRVVAPAYPWFRDVPVVNLALLAAGLWLSFAGARRSLARPARPAAKAATVILGTLNAVLAGLFVFYLVSFSARMPPSIDAPQIGAHAPGFTLPDAAGRPVSLDSLRGRDVLLVFYRGHW